MVRFFIFLVSLLPYIFVFIATLYVPRDPDLGWRLKYGEYFFQHGQILRENIFSSTMSGYSWANGSWGADVITYAIYNLGGFFGLTLMGAVVVTLTFFFFSKAARLTLIEKTLFFPLVVYLESTVNINSFRGQQLSMLFIGILVLLFSKYKPFSKILWSIPILFLFWANVHRESIFGLGMLGIWIVCVLIKDYLTTKKKKFFFNHAYFLLSILFFSFLATFINPFGIGIYFVAFDHINDPLLHTINEFFPLFVFSERWWLHILVLFLFACTIVYLAKKKKLIAYLQIYLIPLLLLLTAFYYKRYAWSAYFLMIPVLHILWQPIEKYTKKYGFFLAYLLSLISIAYVGYLKIPYTQFTDMSWEKFYNNRSLPITRKSAEFLKDHKLTQNLFTFFNWGGYLIWNYPDIKPSVDGRMTVWRDSRGYSAYEEYTAYMYAEKNIDESSFDVVYIPMDRSIPLYAKLSELVSQGKWELVYDDGDVGIVVRIKK